MKFKTKSTGPGGIFIEARRLTASDPIIKTHLPALVRLPMLQDSGKPARAIVSAGDHVEEGQVIGEAPDSNSANIHASVSGKVISVEKGPGYKNIETDIVTISTGGTIKNWYGKKYDAGGLTPEQMMGEIRQSGVVSMDSGLYCTPAQQKLAGITAKEKIDTLIVNAVESLPYLTSGRCIIMEKPADLIDGIRLVMKITGAKDAVIAVEEEKKRSVKPAKPAEPVESAEPSAAEILLSAIRDKPDIRVEVLKTRSLTGRREHYPLDSEGKLILALMKKELPAGKKPREIGIAVENVSTIMAIYEALVYKKPMIERLITYTGDFVAKRGNYKVRIGTPIRLIIEEFGMPSGKGSGPVIAGSPMTGMEITDMNTPVMKNTPGIVVLSKRQDYKALDRPCIRCSRCQESCPMMLRPARLAALCREDDFKEAWKSGLGQCIECGACSYICPSKIPITAILRYGRSVNGSL
ncbi:MAG: RnfABCDGE type electron transport complex subunit C [Brevinematales bacterium]|jgi:electron transport complex protein RnfC